MRRTTDRRAWSPRLASLGLLAIVAVLAAGCGEEAGSGSSAAEGENEAQEAQLEYAQCMREHGVDLPDPTFEEGGPAKQTGPPEGVPQARLEAADEACAKYEFEPPELSDEEQQELKDAVLAHARCMREHGIEDFPDPTFNEKGEAHIPKGSGLDMDDPDFRAAERACQDKRPSGPSAESAP